MRFVLFVVATLVVQDAKEFSKDWKHRWADTTAGSSVTFEVTVMETKATRIETVAKVDGTNVTVEVSEGGAKTNQVIHVGLPSEYTGTCAKGADEEIRVGEKTYKCAVYEVRIEVGQIVQLMKIWRCADAPAWAVKESWSQSKNGTVKLSWVEELTGSEKLTVGGKEFDCAIVRRTTEGASVKGVDTEWRARGIPGGVAKATSQTFISGKVVKEQATTRVATGFERK
jgi:hypothetical protein